LAKRLRMEVDGEGREIGNRERDVKMGWLRAQLTSLPADV